MGIGEKFLTKEEFEAWLRNLERRLTSLGSKSGGGGGGGLAPHTHPRSAITDWGALPFGPNAYQGKKIEIYNGPSKWWGEALSLWFSDSSGSKVAIWKDDVEYQRGIIRVQSQAGEPVTDGYTILSIDAPVGNEKEATLGLCCADNIVDLCNMNYPGATYWGFVYIYPNWGNPIWKPFHIIGNNQAAGETYWYLTITQPDGNVGAGTPEPCHRFCAEGYIHSKQGGFVFPDGSIQTKAVNNRSDITDFWSSPFWNNIPDKPSSFTPSAHASSHHSGGSDPLSFNSISGFSDYLDQAVKQASSPTFATVKLSNLTSGYLPYHTSNGLANSPIYTGGNNVGIGTTTPQTPLQVNGSILITGYTSPYYGLTYTGNYNWLRWIPATDDNPSYGGIVIRNAANTTDIFMITKGGKIYTTDVLQVAGTGNSYIMGNVGIGTTGPTQKLEVNGAIRYTPMSAPSSPQEGTVYYDSTAKKLKVYNGSAWETISSS